MEDNMTFNEFLKKVNCVEENEYRDYTHAEALELIRANPYNLKFVKEQT
jgi:hypothetical protein